MTSVRGIRVVLVAAPLLALLALPALLAPRNFPTDDALFYMQVARHIVAGENSTFDTISATNGYHPLWMVPCLVAARLSRGEPVTMLRIAFLIQQLLAVGALVLLFRLALRLEIRSWAVGAALLAVFFLTGLYGTEAHINGFCILASLLLMARFADAPTIRSGAVFGIALGAMILARLDNVLLAAALLGGATIWTWRAPRRLGGIGAAAISMVLVVSPYLLWNLSKFGHLMPISGAVKTTFPRIYGDLRNLGVLGLATFVIALAGGAALLSKSVTPRRRLLLGSTAVGVVAHGLYITLYTDHNTHWSWYYVAGTLLAALFASVAIDDAEARFSRLPMRAFPVVAVALVMTWGVTRAWARYANSGASSHNQFIFRVLAPAREPRWEVQFAQYLERTLPPRSGVLAFDYPGALAFYSSLRIIPADGLIGGYDYDAEVREKGLAGYLRRHDVRYYVGEVLDPPDSCRAETIFAPIERTDVGSLILCPGDLVASSTGVVRAVPAPAVGLYLIRDVAPSHGAPHGPMKKHGFLW